MVLQLLWKMLLILNQRGLTGGNDDDCGCDKDDVSDEYGLGLNVDG